jgi:hypothetical protein
MVAAFGLTLDCRVATLLLSTLRQCVTLGAGQAPTESCEFTHVTYLIWGLLIALCSLLTLLLERCDDVTVVMMVLYSSLQSYLLGLVEK